MTFFFANIHMQFRIQGHIAKDVYSNSSPYWSLQTQGLCSPWSAGLEDLTVLLGLFSRSHALSLYLTFLIFLPHLPRSLHPFLILIFASKLRLWGVGKWAEQSMWGFEDHLELGDSLCGAASWTYKEMGAGEIEKGGALQGQRGVSRKLRVPGLKLQRGRGVLLSGRSCIQMHSSRTSGLPFTSSAIPAIPVIWIPSPPHPALKTLKRISGKVGALIPKECDSVHVKSSRWQCLPSFQEVW